MIKLPIFILMWAIFLAIKIPVVILGLVVVPLMYVHRLTNYVDLPWWTRPWANPEDWHGQVNTHSNSLPKWWVLKEGVSMKSFYQYHAIRNPANGLRSIELLDLDVTPDLVRFKTNRKMGRYEPRPMRLSEIDTAWYFAWQGFRAGFKIVHIWNDERHLVIKFGWRVEPRDALDKEVTELKKDASFATKFLFYREG